MGESDFRPALDRPEGNPRGELNRVQTVLQKFLRFRIFNPEGSMNLTFTFTDNGLTIERSPPIR